MKVYTSLNLITYQFSSKTDCILAIKQNYFMFPRMFNTCTDSDIEKLDYMNGKFSLKVFFQHENVICPSSIKYEIQKIFWLYPCILQSYFKFVKYEYNEINLQVEVKKKGCNGALVARTPLPSFTCSRSLWIHYKPSISLNNWSLY